MTLFDGKYNAQLLEDVLKLKITDSLRTLAIIQVGDNAASEKYIKLKMDLCQRIGIKVTLLRIPANLEDAEISERIIKICNEPEVGGVIIQLPLPRTSLKFVLDSIPVNKDLDLLSSKSLEQFNSGVGNVLPPVVRAVEYFIRESGITFHRNTVIVIGYGQLVGMPVTTYLRRIGLNVTVLDDYKNGQPLDADLIIISAGVPRLVDPKDILPRCSVIDFGSSVIEGKTIGDLNINGDLSHLAFVSPSPGGMGPLVVRFLVQNFIDISM